MFRIYFTAGHTNATVQTNKGLIHLWVWKGGFWESEREGDKDKYYTLFERMLMINKVV